MDTIVFWHFPRHLQFSWRSITLLCGKQKGVYIQNSLNECTKFSSPGSCPAGLLLRFTQLRSTGNRSRQIPYPPSQPFSHLTLACMLCYSFSCTQLSLALKIEWSAALGPASQKLVVCECRCLPSLEGVLFCYFARAYSANVIILPHFRPRPGHTLRQHLVPRTHHWSVRI